MRGKVRLDGAALDQWSSDVLGRHIGSVGVVTPTESGRPRVVDALTAAPDPRQVEGHGLRSTLGPGWPRLCALLALPDETPGPPGLLGGDGIVAV